MELGALTPEPAGQPISPDHLHHHLKRHGIQTRQLRAAGCCSLGAGPASGDIAGHQRPHRRAFADNLGAVDSSLTSKSTLGWARSAGRPCTYPNCGTKAAMTGAWTALI